MLYVYSIIYTFILSKESTLTAFCSSSSSPCFTFRLKSGSCNTAAVLWVTIEYEVSLEQLDLLCWERIYDNCRETVEHIDCICCNARLQDFKDLQTDCKQNLSCWIMALLIKAKIFHLVYWYWSAPSMSGCQMVCSVLFTHTLQIASLNTSNHKMTL